MIWRARAGNFKCLTDRAEPYRRDLFATGKGGGPLREGTGGRLHTFHERPEGVREEVEGEL